MTTDDEPDDLGPSICPQFEPRFLNLEREVRPAVASVEAAREFLKKHGVLHGNRRCDGCHRPMHETPSRTRDGVKWRCYTRSCGSREASIRAGTILERFRFSLQHAVELLTFWSYSTPPIHCIHFLRLDKKTVHRFYRLLRVIVSSYMTRAGRMVIGGPGMIVEVDETLLARRKYNRGRILGPVDEATQARSQCWVIGGVERSVAGRRKALDRAGRSAAGRGKAFIAMVPRRDGPTLLAAIQQHIAPGTRVLTDQWRGYSRLREHDYGHATVNHSIEFVSSEDPQVHTQSIENLWKHLKDRVRLYGTMRVQATLHHRCNEFLFFRQFSRGSMALEMLLDAVEEFYVDEEMQADLAEAGNDGLEDGEDDEEWELCSGPGDLRDGWMVDGTGRE